jgi:biotin carboxylase
MYVQTVNALRALPLPVVAVIPGAETGVELADRLSARMGLRSNGEEGSLARRNKYDMGEKVRAAGVRAVKQRLCRSEAELLAFFIEEFGVALTGSSSGYMYNSASYSSPDGFRCVVKPVQSAGTDHVFLCDSIDEALTAFASIHGHVNGLGLVNDGALVQEFLAGKEYVIDKVG